MQLSVRTLFEVTGENAQEFYSIQTENNEPFLRDDFLVLLPSRNGHITLEEEIGDKSYQDLLEDDEVLPEEDIEMGGAAVYSGVQASGGIEDEPMNVDERVDTEEEEDRNIYEIFEDYNEEFGIEDELLDEETALMRAIEKSRETAARDYARALSASGGGESSTSARPALASASGEEPSSSAEPTASSSSQQQQTLRKGKERSDFPEVDPKRRRL